MNSKKTKKVNIPTEPFCPNCESLGLEVINYDVEWFCHKCRITLRFEEDE